MKDIEQKAKEFAKNNFKNYWFFPEGETAATIKLSKLLTDFATELLDSQIGVSDEKIYEEAKKHWDKNTPVCHCFEKGAKWLRSQIGDGWVSLKDRLPESGIPVIAYYINSYGKERRIRAMYLPQYFEEDNENYLGDSDYNEENDTYYWPKGWYENNEHEEIHWQVDENITHWMPLPNPPKEVK